MKNDTPGVAISRQAPSRDLSGLSEWAPELAEALVWLSCEIVLVLGQDGLIQRVFQSSPNAIAPVPADWVGRPWVDTVTRETRPKVDNLLREVANTGLGSRREINHSASGDAIPVAYTAIRLGQTGPVIAVGKDLRAVAAIQQRFLDAQRESEQAYWRLRQGEMRYQLLFQVATDAMLLIDGATRQILEANHAATQLFDVAMEEMAGRPATFGFDRTSRALVDELMDTSCNGGKQGEVRASLAGKVVHTRVAVSPFRVQDAMRLVLRVRPEAPRDSSRLFGNAAQQPPAETTEAVLITDSRGRILAANGAFLKLVRASNEHDVCGRPLSEWINAGDSLQSIVERVRSQGLVQRADSSMTSTSGGRPTRVQISASLLTEDDQERIGFNIRPLPQPTLVPDPCPAVPTAAIDELLHYLGDGPLPDLVHKVTNLMQRHVIADAMRRSGGDTKACANLLGIDPTDLEKRLQATGADPR